MPFVPWIIGGLILVVVLRGPMPILGSLLGLGLGIAAGYWGWGIYAQGGTVSLLTMPLPRPAFGGVIALWIASEVVSLWRAVAKRRNPPEADYTNPS